MAGEKGIILDFNDEYGEFGIKSISLENLPIFMSHPAPDIRRIRPFKPDGKGFHNKMNTSEMLTTLEKVLAIWKGGALLIEDPNKYIDDHMPSDLVGAMCTNRHNDCDIIMHYQSVARPLPKVWQNTDIVRFHWQSDDVERSKGKLEDMTRIFKIAQILVNDQKLNKNNKYFHVYVDRNTGKIIGNFSHAMFDEALDEYISFNHKELKPWTVKRDGMGRAVYTYPQAVAEFKNYLKKLYWGNDLVAPKEREGMIMLATGFKGHGKSWQTIEFLKKEYCGMPSAA